MTTISLCVCTYKRPEMLLACLASVGGIQVPEGLQVFLIVVDNDEKESSKGVLSQVSSDFPIDIRYVCEQKRGIPCARNRSIRESQKLGADYLVFIDDDEWVEPDWLFQLFNFCKLKGGDVVVSGAVYAELPDNIPKAIKAQFLKQKRITGEKVSSCATNNVIVPMKAIEKTGIQFDETFPLAGGTDTIFFHQLSGFGVEIFKCMEAVVHERIPPNRATIRWLSKRKYRAGITDAWRKSQKGRSSLSIAASSFGQVVLNVVKSLFLLCVGRREESLRYCLKACKAYGTASGVFGVKVDSY